ncbi:hypothetical protein K0M31_015418 [Melipona bicolor]|uniref:Uncharacterized protein n=1 Tax=Melipona bicolor TaxID=60889 RepID=A0AA40KF64_9HYME|nr:hypothetical protein K0M31_015418 [Melipona bicolor]
MIVRFVIRSVVDPSQRENLGIIVQYKVKVKLCLGPLGGEADCDDDIIFEDFARLRLKDEPDV